jgi:hypothetical protein
MIKSKLLSKNKTYKYGVFFQNTVGPNLPHFLGGRLLLAAMSLAGHGGRPHEVLRQGDDPPIGGGTGRET